MSIKNIYLFLITIEVFLLLALVNELFTERQDKILLVIAITTIIMLITKNFIWYKKITLKSRNF
jgi:hypothetical protein